MVAVRHFGFLKFHFLTVEADKRAILHQRTKFRKNRSNCCGHIAIFVIFKTAATDILDLKKNDILTVSPLNAGSEHHRAKCYQNLLNGCRDMAI